MPVPSSAMRHLPLAGLFIPLFAKWNPAGELEWVWRAEWLKGA
jgi:hypothetical protein